MESGLTFEKVWTMFQEIAKESEKRSQETERKFQETERKFQETDKKFQEIIKEADKRSQETDKKIQEIAKQLEETKNILNQKFQETENQLKEEAKDSRKKLKELEKLFVGHWGKLMEALVNNALLEVLNSRGIRVNQTAQRVVKVYNGKEYEIDIIAENGDEVVFVEVKTTLRPEHVQNFLDKLKLVRKIFPLYRSLKIYGAVAYLHSEAEAKTFAMNSGL